MIVGYIIIGLLGLLGLLEVARFIRARGGERELPYPRRRLTRRLGIAVLLGGLVFLAMFWPQEAPIWVQLVLLGLLLGGFLLSLVLIWRDLGETSRTIMGEAVKLHREAGESMQGLLERSKKKPQNDKSDGPPSKNDHSAQ